MKQLLEEREDLYRQLKQLMLEYEGLKQGSSEKLALETMIATMRLNFAKVQQKLIKMRLLKH